MILSLLVIASFLLYCYLAVLSLTMISPRTLSHWLLFASACCAAYWSLFSFFTYNADSLPQLKSWFYISVLGMFVYFPVNLLFVLSIIPGRILSKKLGAAIILPSILLFILNFRFSFVFNDFILGAKGWIFIPAYDQPLNLIWIIYAGSCFAAGIILMTIWLKTSHFNRERKQIHLLIATQISAEILILLEYRLDEFLSTLRPASISPILISIWIIGMVIAVKRYNFLSISPETISEEILNSLGEAVILVDESERVTYMNPKAVSMFEKSYLKLENEKIETLISTSINNSSIIPPVIRDSNGSGLSAPIKLRLNNTDASRPELEMNVRRIQDRFGDFLGYLFIGREVLSADLKQKILHKQWNLTPREYEIALLITEGFQNREISEKLAINEQTVKNHLSVIYRKTSVSDRTALFHLISEKTPPT